MKDLLRQHDVAWTNSHTSLTDFVFLARDHSDGLHLRGGTRGRLSSMESQVKGSRRVLRSLNGPRWLRWRQSPACDKESNEGRDFSQSTLHWIVPQRKPDEKDETRVDNQTSCLFMVSVYLKTPFIWSATHIFVNVSARYILLFFFIFFFRGIQ